MQNDTCFPVLYPLRLYAPVRYGGFREDRHVFTDFDTRLLVVRGKNVGCREQIKIRSGINQRDKCHEISLVIEQTVGKARIAFAKGGVFTQYHVLDR